MGLFSAMNASVSGLGATGQAIGVISDNLANTNTIGYKASNTLFSQLVTNAASGGSSYNSGGVGVAVLRDQSSQGSFISSSSKTDLAISGNGFFKVADNSLNSTETSYYYTRAGSFSEDKEGYLVNPDGFYLQGWKTDADGNILDVQNPEAVELQSVGVSAQRSTELSLVANLTSTEDRNILYDTSGTLQASLDAFVADPTKADYVTDVRVYDAQGGGRDMTMIFTKRADNLWDWQLVTDGGNIQGGTVGTDTRVANGTLEFTTTGSLKYSNVLTGGAASGGMDVAINWAGGVDPSTLTLNLGDYTGGNIVSATSAGLAYQTGTTTDVTATTVAGTVATDMDVSGSTIADGTYYLVLTADNTLVLSDTADGLTNPVAMTSPAPGGLTPSTAQTVTFADGTVIDLSASFDTAPGGGFPISEGTFTVGDRTTGGVLNIAAENDALGVGTYTLVKINATTIGLSSDGGTTIDETATIASTGTRDVYFSSSQLRVTVSNDFDETDTYYPSTIGTFTVSAQNRLTDGVGSNGVTQLAASYNTKGVNQNGFGAGTISSISVDEDGFVIGNFTNGETKKLYKIALAVFQNPDALDPVSGSLLRVTDASGQALLKQAGIGGTGRLVSGALEGSTADIATEFSNMIVAQRAFQASSKVITTVDQMLNELLQLR